MSDSSDKATVDAAVSESLKKFSNTADIAKKAYLTVAIGLGGFLIWAAFAPLDQGVPTMGTVSIETKRKPIQHLQGGIISEIFVQEGQDVSKGDPLLTLNDTTLRADFESIRQQFFSLKAIEGRLRADQVGSEKIIFDAELLDASLQDPELEQQMQNEIRLLRSKRHSLASQLKSFHESSKGYEGQFDSASAIARNLNQQKMSLEEELVGIKKLVQEGFAPLSQQLTQERAIAAIDSQIAENQARRIQAQQAMIELQQAEIRTRADYQLEIEQELSQLRPKLLALAERFKAVSDSLTRSTILSPVAGQIVGLQLQNVGSVIGPGQKIMDIVPEDEALLIEARIDPSLIDRVREGDPVDLRFSAFANTPQLVIPGVLESLSADVINEGSNGSLPFYLGRIKVTQEGIETLGSRTLQPGMAVVAIIKTGRRTFLEYIVHPLTIRLASSLKEE